MTQVSFDFKMELFIPSSLTAFGADDHIENKVATAQTAVTLTTLMPTTGTLQVTFSNLDITLGCNGKYGYQGHFALFTYPINCANFDDFCEALEPIYPRTCAMPNGGSETLFRYDNGMPPPFGLEALNIVSPTEEVGDLRMDMEIAYTNTIQCTCDTSIEMANGDCNSETGFLALFGETITQEFTTDCFSSQPLQSIDIMIGWNVDNMVHQWTTTGPQETFTLVIKDTDNTVRDTIQVLWSSSSVDPAMNFYTETIIFPISASDFFIGCGTDLKWTLSCADCSVRDPARFYSESPFVVDCPALHMANDPATTSGVPLPTGMDLYSAFELVADVTFTCPSGATCLPLDQCPTDSPSGQPSTTPTKTPTSNPTNNPITTDPSRSPTLMPTSNPSKTPTLMPTSQPSSSPTFDPSSSPTGNPSAGPTNNPSTSPLTSAPSTSPVTSNPTSSPVTAQPTTSPFTANPTENPSTSNPTSSPVTPNPSVSPVTPNPTVSPVTSRVDCDDVRRVISWSMVLLDGIDTSTNAFQDEFDTIVLDALKEAILVISEKATFKWCLGLQDVVVSFVNGRRLLSNEVNVEATFNYDNELETDVFGDDSFSADELEMSFGTQVTELAQERSFMSEDDDITSISVGEAVTISSADGDDSAVESDTTIDHVTVAIICIVCIALLLMILGYLNSKCRSADDFKYGAVILFGIYAWDFFSDILFAVDIWLKYLSSTPEKDIPETAYSRTTSELMLSIVFGCSVAFIILPLMKNFFDLIKFQGFWQKHPLHADRYRSWLDQYGTLLFALSFMCGSTFGAVSLVNSNLFGKRLFSMGLSKYDLRQFNQKRLINVIVGENLPQILIQIFYASAVEGGVTTIAFAAIASSTLSVCAAVLDFASKKKLLADETVNQTLFSVKVASTQEEFTQKVGKFKHKTRQLMAEIAHMFPLDRRAVEILPIEKFSDHTYDGLVLYFFISTSKFEPKQLFEKLNFNNKAHLAKQIAKAWRLNAKQLVVYDLEFMLKSQDTGHFVEIQLNEYVKQTDVKEDQDIQDDVTDDALPTDHNETPKPTNDGALPHTDDTTPDGDGEMDTNLIADATSSQ